MRRIKWAKIDFNTLLKKIVKNKEYFFYQIASILWNSILKVWTQCRNRQIYQRNKKKKSKMLLHTCNLEYNKGGISNQQKKEGMFNNDNGKYPFYKKKN